MEINYEKMEDKKVGFFYLAALYLTSFWAMITNSVQALFVKIRKPSLPFSKILWELGRDEKHCSSFAVDKFSKFNHQGKVFAAGWKSLDLFYNYYEKVDPKLKNNFEGFLTKFWIQKLENRQAVANRKNIASDLLVDAFKSFSNEKEIRLVSVASGSAQAVLDAIKKVPNLNIKVTLIDFDKTAIAEAKKSVKELGWENNFSFVNDTTRALERVCDQVKPHIIEMVGFLDYRPRKKAIDLISRIYDCLPTDGVFLTCNINHNKERIFLDWVLLWPMIYRSKEEMKDIITKAGFSSENVDIEYEPLKIHSIAICKK